MRLAIVTALILAASTAFPQEPSPPTTEPKAPAESANVVKLRQPIGTAWWEAERFQAKVSLSLVRADLQTTAAALSKASGLSLIVAHSGTRSTKKITLQLKNAPLRDVLLAIANLYDLTWFEQGDVYVLTYLTKKDRDKIGSGRFVRPPSQPGMAGPTSVGQPIPSPSAPPRQRVRVVVPAPPKR